MIWRARLREDPPLSARVLCGRLDRGTGRYVCNEVVATLWHHPGGSPSVVIALPPGVTEAGSPGRWRVTSYVKKKRAEGRKASMKRGTKDEETGRRQPRGMVATVFPFTAPCAKGHENQVDYEVLGA